MIAISRSSSVSLAFQTVPNVPAPSCSTSSKWPILLPMVLKGSVSSSTRLKLLPHDGHEMFDSSAYSTNSIGLWQCGQRTCMVLSQSRTSETLIRLRYPTFRMAVDSARRNWTSRTVWLDDGPWQKSTAIIISARLTKFEVVLSDSTAAHCP